jgi:hypothetical protein
MLEQEQTPLKPAPAPQCSVASMLLLIAREGMVTGNGVQASRW